MVRKNALAMIATLSLVAPLQSPAQSAVPQDVNDLVLACWAQPPLCDDLIDRFIMSSELSNAELNSQIALLAVQLADEMPDEYLAGTPEEMPAWYVILTGAAERLEVVSQDRANSLLSSRDRVLTQRRGVSASPS